MKQRNGTICRKEKGGAAQYVELKLPRVPTSVSEIQQRSVGCGHQFKTEVCKALKGREFDYACIKAGKPWRLQLNCKRRFGVTFISLIQGTAMVSFDDQHRSSPIYAGDVIVAFGRQQSSLWGISQVGPVDLFKLGEQDFDKITKIGGDTSPSIFLVAFLDAERLSGGPLFAKNPRFLWMRPDPNRSHHFQVVLDLLTRESAKPSICSRTVVPSLCKILVMDAIRTCRF